MTANRTPSISQQVEAEILRVYFDHDGPLGTFVSGNPLNHDLYARVMGKHAVAILDRMARERLPSLDPNKTVGARALNALPQGEAPEQLLPPFLSPEGPTVLYGPGDVGKGMLSVHFALSLVSKGLNVMIIDFEHHEHEWGRRARAMGGTEEELKRIHYRAPFADDWTAPRGALIHVAPYIRADCEAREIDYVIIDSYSMATTTGDSLGGLDAAQEFYAGIATIGRPSLVLAHVTGGGGRFPAKPFGSVFVHNLARETWAAEQTETDVEIPFDPKTAHLQPTVMILELRNRKMNNGPRPDNQYIAFSFFGDGHIEVNHAKRKKVSIGDMAVFILNRAKAKALSTDALRKSIREHFEEDVSADSLRAALRRDRKVKRDDNDLWVLTEAASDDD